MRIRPLNGTGHVRSRWKAQLADAPKDRSAVEAGTTARNGVG